MDEYDIWHDYRHGCLRFDRGKACDRYDYLNFLIKKHGYNWLLFDEVSPHYISAPPSLMSLRQSGICQGNCRYAPPSISSPIFLCFCGPGRYTIAKSYHRILKEFIQVEKDLVVSAPQPSHIKTIISQIIKKFRYHMRKHFLLIMNWYEDPSHLDLDR